jgi:hypothetical protein
MNNNELPGPQAPFDGSHWVFIAFDPWYMGRLAALLAEVGKDEDRVVPVVSVSAPPGAFWHGRACDIVAVSETELNLDLKTSKERLARHLGRVRPGPEGYVFQLGTPPDTLTIDGLLKALKKARAALGGAAPVLLALMGYRHARRAVLAQDMATFNGQDGLSREAACTGCLIITDDLSDPRPDA